MAALDFGKTSSKSIIRITSVFYALWGIAFSGLLGLSLKVKFPVDIITNPFIAVESLFIIIIAVHLCLMAILSSATGYSCKLIFKNLVRCVVGIMTACIIFHILAMLFGAPVFESSRETFHFALLLTSLTAVPSCFALGADGGKWITVYAMARPALGVELVVFVTSITSLLGAWLGAVPIPLDWDRPWQVWPVSCVLGSLFGYGLGLLLSAAYLPLRYSQLQKNKLT